MSSPTTLTLPDAVSPTLSDVEAMMSPLLPMSALSASEEEYVVKRNGKHQRVSFDKVLDRTRTAAEGLCNSIHCVEVSQNIISGIYPGITTSQLDEIASRFCAGRIVQHTDYDIMASRLVVSSHHKNTKCYKERFSNVFTKLYENVDSSGRRNSLISQAAYDFMVLNREALDASVDYNRDYDYSYFGFTTLIGTYLKRSSDTDEVIERPQDLLMRVAIGVSVRCGIDNDENVRNVIETYDILKNGDYTHATPTLFNACSTNCQYSSCFVLHISDDSIEGIYKTLMSVANISKWAGGVGMSVSNVRAKGSIIHGTNGRSTGIVPMLRVFNNTALYVNQGGKRNGSFAIYIEPWHADIFDVLKASDKNTEESARASDLFYGIWASSIFMRRVIASKEHYRLSTLPGNNSSRLTELEPETWWYLMCPAECPGLVECHSEAFDELYLRYVSEGRYRKKIRVLDLMDEICKMQIQTGNPYMCFKDHVNAKSNHQHLGTIRSSNLCTEIMEYYDKEHFAVCNLASVCLPKFVKQCNGVKVFDHDRLIKVIARITENLDNVISNNFYPTPECEQGNTRDRPIGIGVQGLADAFILMGYPFDSPEAKQLNIDIFETMYYAFLRKSCDLAKERGVYPSYPGSPLSRGILQPDMWGVAVSDRLPFEKLRADLNAYGARNSLGIAPMPTASTSQIMGNSIAIEPYNGNFYVRRTLAGEFTVVNKYMWQDLERRGILGKFREDILASRFGSIQSIQGIPADIKKLYKTSWDIRQSVLIDMAADRGAFVCQSQSLNLFFRIPTIGLLVTAHIRAFEKGLKTSSYYIHQDGQARAISFATDPNRGKTTIESDTDNTPEDCVMCSA